MINPNEAPDGYRAVREESAGRCTGCHFLTGGTEIDACAICNHETRKDGHEVIFVREDKSSREYVLSPNSLELRVRELEDRVDELENNNINK